MKTLKSIFVCISKPFSISSYSLSVMPPPPLKTVLRIRIRLDPFQFGQPDPDSFHETDPGKKKSVKIMENFYKNQPKSWKISTKSTKIMRIFT